MQMTRWGEGQSFQHTYIPGTTGYPYKKRLTWPNLIHRLHTIPIQMLTGFLVDMDELILKFTCSCRRPRIIKIILKQRNKIASFYLTSKLACCGSDATRKPLPRLWHLHVGAWSSDTCEGYRGCDWVWRSGNGGFSLSLGGLCNWDGPAELPCSEVREPWLLCPPCDHSLAAGSSREGL